MPARPFRIALCCSFIALICAAAGVAQNDLAQRASTAYRAQDWPATEAAALAMLKSDAESAQGHFFLAVALMHRGESTQALAHLDQAERSGYPAFAVEFRRACAESMLGHLDEAFSALGRAVAAGFAQSQVLAGEPLLEAVRADPRYAEVQAAIEKARHPCRNDARYRQFDFWLGTWDVRPNGAPESSTPSENVITLEYDGCVVMEHWTGTSGVTGSSFNLYDSSRDEWFQTWVDSTGGLHEYHGKPDADGNMIFEGTTPGGGPGQPARLPTRLSFFRLGPDRVRQYSESSADGGESWSVNYDLIYLRRPGTSKP